MKCHVPFVCFTLFLSGISWDIRFEFTDPRSLDLYCLYTGVAIYNVPFSRCVCYTSSPWKKVLQYDETFIHHFFVVMCMQGVTWHVDHIARILIDTSHFSTNFPLWTSQLVLPKNSRSWECEKSRIFLVMCLPGGNSEQFPGFDKIRICVNVFL